ncbi:MAG: DUF3330 domain-containing protein [Gammaproteobacteria bacterium]|nr:DUF3330 domain-containing protein [Gammaproteobacteria bacterium]MCK5092423.1 DUF3330 domain-containing protein [Gammaproteobacteria bacterium]
MTDTSKNVDTDLVKCEICLKEVPKSEAKVAEAQEYVMHFCGLDCYDKWQKKSESEAKEDSQ